MNIYKITWVMLFGMFCYGMTGCAGSRLTPEPAIDRETVVTALNQNRPEPETMRIMTKIDYFDGQKNQRVVGQDLILSVKTPGYMRITISAFDKAISTLVTDGKGFSLMDVSQNAYVTGLATPENIAKILPVYLSGMDLYRVIHGQYPVDGMVQDNTKIQIEWDGKKGGYCQTIPLNNGQIERVYYSWPEKDIFLMTVSQGDETVYTYEASGFKEYSFEDNVARYPSQILFSLPKQNTDVRLRVENRDLDVEFSEAVFRLHPPANANIMVLDEFNGEISESKSTQE